MGTTRILLCCWPLLFAAVTPASAHQASSNEICGEVKHNVKHEITSGPNKGTYSCDATSCVQTSNGTPTGAVKTYYENCTAALTRPPQNYLPLNQGILEASPEGGTAPNGPAGTGHVAPPSRGNVGRIN